MLDLLLRRSQYENWQPNFQKQDQLVMLEDERDHEHQDSRLKISNMSGRVFENPQEQQPGDVLLN